MISTRNLNVKLSGSKRRLENVTTKTIDTSIKVTKPDGTQVKSPLISTRNLGDISDMVEGKKRAAISAERKKEAKETAKPKKPWNKMNAEERKEYQRIKKEKK